MTHQTRQRRRARAQHENAAQWAYKLVRDWPSKLIRETIADTSHDDHPGVSGVRRGMQLRLQVRAMGGVS